MQRRYYQHCLSRACSARMRRIRQDDAESEYRCPDCGFEVVIDLQLNAVVACSNWALL